MYITKGGKQYMLRETETETEDTPMRREACKYVAGKEERINA